MNTEELPQTTDGLQDAEQEFFAAPAGLQQQERRSSQLVRFDMEEANMAYTQPDPSNFTRAGLKGSLSGSIINSESSAHGSNDRLHRRRTLYLIRHGEAEHNVLEKQAQDQAKQEAETLGLSPDETWERMEEARKAVLLDAGLRDAALTDQGRQQAREAAARLEQIVAEGKAHPPTEAMCSPLSRCLETCQIILENYEIQAHIRNELQERQTLYPPDTPKTLEELMQSGITRNDSRFIFNMDSVSPEHAEEEAKCRESKEMLRERASQLFDLLMKMEHRHVLVVSHKG